MAACLGDVAVGFHNLTLLLQHDARELPLSLIKLLSIALILK